MSFLLFQILFEAGAASSAEVLPPSSSKVKEGTRFGKFRVKHIKAKASSIKEFDASLVSTGFLLKTDTARLRTTLARKSGNTEVEVGIHICPVCAGHIDTGTQTAPLN